MALSDKAQALLKRIYAHHRYGEEELVDENPDEALEYVLQEIADTLAQRQHQGAPLDDVTEDAVMALRSDRVHGRKAQTS